ncbi:hypothetical protein [Christensenella intestinihominis]|uniref:hypothetical protein n=1 Tax=Christensenella intestinihominis TaxID=1851429 RepID=UPI00082A782F|nr:hypothetical protein [Christensenella intestinihominis]
MIRGIDGQIMINKSVDYAKQMADQINNVQQGQDFISEMEKARMNKSDQAVAETDRTEDGRIRREKNDKSKQEDRPPEQQSADDKEAVLEDAGVEGRETGLGNSIDINV